MARHLQNKLSETDPATSWTGVLKPRWWVNRKLKRHPRRVLTNIEVAKMFENVRPWNPQVIQTVVALIEQEQVDGFGPAGLQLFERDVDPPNRPRGRYLCGMGVVASETPFGHQALDGCLSFHEPPFQSCG